MVLDEPDGGAADDEQSAGKDEHINLGSQNTRCGEEDLEDQAANGSCYNLRHADGAVEETEICAYMATLERIGENREGQSQHSSPSCTNEQERGKESVLAVDEVGGDEADATHDERDGVSHLVALEAWDDGSPEYRTDGLDGKEDAYPVTCILILLRGCIEDHGTCFGNLGGCIKGAMCDRTVGIGPHVHERCPAEELYEADGPEGGRSLLEQFEHTGLVLMLLGIDGMVLVVLLGRILLHHDRGVDDADDEDGGTDVEGVLHRVGHDAGGSCA